MQEKNTAAALLCSLQCHVQSKTLREKSTGKDEALTPLQLWFASEYLYFGRVFDTEK